MFGSNDTNTYQQPAAASYRVQTSAGGMAIPLVYGRQRLSGNLMWVGTLNPVWHQNESAGGGGKGGSGGSTNTGGYYDYYIPAIFGICEGPVQEITTVWKGKRKLRASSGVDGQTPFTGALGQAVWGYLTSKYPDQAVPYSGIAYYAANNIYMGTSPNMPNYNFEVLGQKLLGLVDLNVAVTISTSTNLITPPDITKFRKGMAITLAATTFPKVLDAAGNQISLVAGRSYWVRAISGGGFKLTGAPGNKAFDFATAGSGVFAVHTINDCLPSDIIEDILTNPTLGVNFPLGNIAANASFDAYCKAFGFFYSLAMSSSEGAAQIIEDMVKCANSAALWSGGQLNFLPYGDEAKTANGATYTPNVTPVYNLTDDDFIPISGTNSLLTESGAGDPIEITRKSISDCYNAVIVEYLDRCNEYNTSTVEARDQAHIDTFGLRKMAVISAHFICETAIAQQVAQNILQRELYIRNTYKFQLGWKYARLEPMDLVTLTDAGLGLAQEVVRITEISEDSDGLLSITAEDFKAGAHSATAYPVETNTIDPPDMTADPGLVNVPMIFEPPIALTGGQEEVWVTASGSDPDYGGAVVFVSYDGASYTKIGQITGNARQGVVTAFMASGSDPDSANTLSVDMTQSAGQLISVGADDLNAFNTLSLVGNELIAYQTATLTGANTYNLTTLRRGAYGSTIAAHGVGEAFCRLDGNVVRWPFEPARKGKTVFFKFCAFNNKGDAPQDIALATQYSYLIAGEPAQVPTGISATGDWRAIILHWTNPTNFSFDHVEILENTTNNSSTATVIAIVAGNSYTRTGLGSGDTRYYWLRSVNRSGNVSALSGVATAMALDTTADIINQITGPDKPLVVSTLSSPIYDSNGNPVPPGTYINSAFIYNGYINNAQIGNVIQSVNYNSATHAGWKLDKAGSLEINGLTVYDNAGNVLLNAGGTPWNAVSGRPIDTTNLIRQPTFESGVNATWGMGSVIAAVTGQLWTKALQVSARDTLESTEFPAKPGDTFFIGADLNSTGTSYSLGLGIMFQDAANGVTGWLLGAAISAGTGWTRQEGTVVAPANTVKGVPWIQIGGFSGLGTGLLANLSITRTAPGATKNIVTYSASPPSSPGDGDVWVDTSVNPNVTKVRVGGAWQIGANLATNTNQLTDGANLGSTAVWTGVSSKPANVGALTGSEVINNAYLAAQITLAAGGILPNWDINIIDDAGKPAGIYPVEGIADRSGVDFGDGTNTWLKLSHASNGTLAYGFPAIPIDDKQKYQITIRHKATAASSSGLYLRFNELAGALPQGMTHVGFGAMGATTTTRTSTFDLVASGPLPGTAWQTDTYTYTPTAGTTWASFSFYKWVPIPTSTDYHVDSVQVIPIAKTGAEIAYSSGGTLDSLKPATAGATKNVVSYSASAPASPTDGDVWGDTSVNPPTFKVRVSGAWQPAANYVSNTNQISDGAGLGTTATWGGVSGKPSNIGSLTGSEILIQQNLSGSGAPSPGAGNPGDSYWDGTNGVMYIKNAGVGWLRVQPQITSANIATYMASAAIGSAQIGSAAVGSLQVAGNAVSAPYYFDGTAHSPWTASLDQTIASSATIVPPSGGRIRIVEKTVVGVSWFAGTNILQISPAGGNILVAGDFVSLSGFTDNALDVNNGGWNRSFKVVSGTLTSFNIQPLETMHAPASFAGATIGIPVGGIAVSVAVNADSSAFGTGRLFLGRLVMEFNNSGVYLNLPIANNGQLWLPAGSAGQGVSLVSNYFLYPPFSQSFKLHYVGQLTTAATAACDITASIVVEDGYR